MKVWERCTTVILPGLLLLLSFQYEAESQENNSHITAYEDYAEEILSADDTYLASFEEWQDIIDQWLEKPLCINNEEADWLMEYKIISLYQLNRLKEYRLMYGSLLSVYELSCIEGWDFQSVRKVIPLVTANLPKESRGFRKFSFRSFRQSLILKTAINTNKSKGYKEGQTDTTVSGAPVYSGPPLRISLRYDLEYRDKLAFGLRMEKDPGEPIFISSSSTLKNIKTPDMFSGFILLKELGPVHTFIAGNYRVNFGYGVNLAGGQSGFSGRNGMAGMANRIRPQTSVGESGFFRGAALSAGSGRFTMTGFASFQNIDGTSLEIDSLGNPISFSSFDQSGLHRTADELKNRKSVKEKIFGGFLVYSNNWMKTGLIMMYNEFDAAVEKSNQPYKKFAFNGRANLIAGFSTAIWLPKIHLFNETSICQNKSSALVTGLEMLPSPGAQISLIHSYFDVGYQNLYGSGIVSSGRNSGENSLQLNCRVELPKKWLVEMTTEIARSLWVSYNLKAPSNQQEIRILTEKAWPLGKSMAFSFRYLQNSVNDPGSSFRITHPAKLSQYKFRLEGRFEANPGFRFKTRLECDFSSEKLKAIHPGWLLFQDIEYSFPRTGLKFWLRACIYDVPDYAGRIYAYENDVLYDFTSYMHYGKGLRGILMFSYSPAHWLDLWLRFSTVYCSDRQIGSGWDEIEGNRQNEIEIQVRIRIPA